MSHKMTRFVQVALAVRPSKIKIKMKAYHFCFTRLVKATLAIRLSEIKIMFKALLPNYPFRFSSIFSK